MVYGLSLIFLFPPAPSITWRASESVQNYNRAYSVSDFLFRTKSDIVRRQNGEETALEVTRVQEFVSKSHADLNGVQELLAQEPALINSAWDWGGGDWETGLGAAAHMGRHDIADYLLENGARRRSVATAPRSGAVLGGDVFLF